MSINSVLILGAGIAGLAAAHELRKRGFVGDVTILEQNEIIGGQARSSYVHGSVQGGGGVPKVPGDPDTQHCWRIYGPGYKVLRNMMKEIPLVDDASKSVHDNLVDTELYLVAGADGQSFRLNYSITALIGYNKMMKNVPILAKWRLINKFLTLFLCSKARILTDYDQISWKEYLGPLPHEEEVYCVEATGPFLGFDVERTSANSVGIIAEGAVVNRGDLSVMNAPTNEAWFRHWYAYLTNQLNVKILTKCQVKSIVTTNVSTGNGTGTGDVYIDHVVYHDKNNDSVVAVSADKYICSLPIEVVSDLFDENAVWANEFSELAKRATYEMVAITIYWPVKLTFPHPKTGIYIAESPWDLIIEPCGGIWSRPINYNGGKIRDSWNVGLCNPKQKGTYIQKSWIDCTRDEVFQEVVWQLHNTKSLTDVVIADPSTLPWNSDIVSIKNIQPVGYNLWEGYKSITVNGKPKIVTAEPKFGPNKGTYVLRPQTQSEHVKNMLFSTVYVSNPFTPILMDQAANAGVMAARAIMPRGNGKKRAVEKYASADRFDRIFPIALVPFRAVDRVCWQVGLGSPFRFQPGLWLMLYFMLILVSLFMLFSRFS